MNAQDMDDDSTLLSDHVARDVLARAATLDAHRDSAVSIRRLREIAREAGIHDDAFAKAVAEVRGAASGSLLIASEPLHARARSIVRDASSRLSSGAITNAIAFGTFWALLGVATRISSALGAPWQVHHAVMIGINVLGVGIAVRLRARATAIVLAITTAAQLAEYPIQLLFGIDKLQGGGTKWALMLAGAVGLAFGAWIMRARRPQSPAAELQSYASVADSATAPQRKRRWWWVQAQLLPRTA